jgi:hypothetical protein
MRSRGDRTAGGASLENMVASKLYSIWGPFAHPSQIVREAKATMEDFHRFNVKENESAVLQENQALTI